MSTTITAVRLKTDVGFAWPVLDTDRAELIRLTRACQNVGVAYRLGAKAPSLNALPGVDFTRIDCSGFVRWLIWGATKYAIPDGSVQQHDWVQEKGFKPSTIDACRLGDEAVRIAFLPPLLAFGFVGHVALVYQGQTLESYGNHGPGRRVWNGSGWQARSKVYVLDLAPG